MPAVVLPLKKQQKPLVVWFRLYGQEKADMQAVAGKRRGAHNAVAHAGTMAEIARLKVKAVGLTPAVAKAVVDFQRLTGLDPVTFLRDAARRSIPIPLRE